MALFGNTVFSEILACRNANAGNKGIIDVCRSRQYGITLIEILVTLVIAGLILAVAVPSLDRYLDAITFRGKVEEIGRDIARMRITALVNQQVIVFPQTDQFGNISYNGLSEPLPPGWRIDGTPVIFFDSGACSGGTLSLEAPDGRNSVLEFKAPLCPYESSL